MGKKLILLFSVLFFYSIYIHLYAQQNSKKEIIQSQKKLSNQFKWGKFESNKAKTDLDNAMKLDNHIAALIGCGLIKEDLDIDMMVRRNSEIGKSVKEFNDYLGKYRAAKNEFERRRIAESEKTDFKTKCKKIIDYSENGLFLRTFSCEFGAYSFTKKAFPVIYKSPFSGFWDTFIKIQSIPGLFPNEIKMNENDAEALASSFGAAKRSVQVFVLMKVVDKEEVKLSYNNNPQCFGVLCEPISTIFVVGGRVVAVLDKRDVAKQKAIQSVYDAAKNLMDGNPMTASVNNVETYLASEQENEKRFMSAIVDARSLGEKDIEEKILEVLHSIDSCKNESREQIEKMVSFKGIYSKEVFPEDAIGCLDQIILRFGVTKVNRQAPFVCIYMQERFGLSDPESCLRYSAIYEIKEGIAHCYLTTKSEEKRMNFIIVPKKQESIYGEEKIIPCGFAPRLSFPSGLGNLDNYDESSFPEIEPSPLNHQDESIDFYFNYNWTYTDIQENGKAIPNDPDIGKKLNQPTRIGLSAFTPSKRNSNEGFFREGESRDAYNIKWKRGTIMFSKKINGNEFKIVISRGF